MGVRAATSAQSSEPGVTDSRHQMKRQQGACVALLSAAASPPETGTLLPDCRERWAAGDWPRSLQMSQLAGRSHSQAAIDSGCGSDPVNVSNGGQSTHTPTHTQPQRAEEMRLHGNQPATRGLAVNGSEAGHSHCRVHWFRVLKLQLSGIDLREYEGSGYPSPCGTAPCYRGWAYMSFAEGALKMLKLCAEQRID